ncbi:hypothetical protein Rsub_08865 [Raphidocelis subcapitata]|uniref:Uncharacterized protein n=1 Tax=Raphidocelis subcapitata TaxID=307507 RepID=A0A2V0PDS4_9CHLO|nr:hypothetical protein Rsub_08865 [Raphidocelis subcapitata]|eukprot:GBF96050.1 hypothetical protein Rsub_08865 [Raphidocelis subcapitata]
MSSIRSAARHLKVSHLEGAPLPEVEEGALPGSSRTIATEAALVAQLAGTNTQEHVVETTAWHAAAEPPTSDPARYAEALQSYAAEAPSTLRTDKAKLQYLKGQHFWHVASWAAPMKRRGGGGGGGGGGGSGCASPRSPGGSPRCRTPRGGAGAGAGAGGSGGPPASPRGAAGAVAAARAIGSSSGGGGGGSARGVPSEGGSSSTGSAVADLLSLPGSPYAQADPRAAAASPRGRAGARARLSPFAG